MSELVPVYRSELSVFKDLSNIVSKGFMHSFSRKKRLVDARRGAELCYTVAHLVTQARSPTVCRARPFDGIERDASPRADAEG